MVRRKKVQISLKNSAHILYDDFNEVFMTEWRKAALAEAKSELKRRVDDKTYQAFELYGLQGRDAEQVAEILDMTLPSLYTAKSRCIKMMHEIIERYNRTDGELNLEL
jgi:DNA-directed RNA polymerase specialized sigma24 family protein